MDKQVIVYNGADDVRLEVQTDGETVWLTQEQMCRLFGRERTVITKHINNVFNEGELPREGFVQILHKTSTVGGRPIAIYNLDVVISVGYRVKSFQGTRFRQWYPPRKRGSRFVASQAERKRVPSDACASRDVAESA